MRDWLRPASGYMAAICSSFEKVDILVRSKENVGRETKKLGLAEGVRANRVDGTELERTECGRVYE